MSNKKMSFISGIIIFFAAILFCGSILWLSGKKMLFTNHYKLFFEFSNVSGIRDNSPVFMRGYQIGLIKNLYFKDHEVWVTAFIKKNFHIPADSQIEIYMLNPIGEKAISITPGKSNNYLKPNSIISGQNKDLMILVKEILSEVKAKIEKADLEQDIREKINKSFKSFAAIINTIHKKIDRFDLAMYNQQIIELGKAAKQFRESIETIQDDIHNFSSESRGSFQKFNQSLEQGTLTMKQIADLSAEIRTISNRLNEGQGTAGQFINNKKYIQNFNSVLEELKAFLKDIQKHPKKYVKFSIF